MREQSAKGRKIDTNSKFGISIDNTLAQTASMKEIHFSSKSITGEKVLRPDSEQGPPGAGLTN